jgi:hypothetical protein
MVGGHPVDVGAAADWTARELPPGWDEPYS